MIDLNEHQQRFFTGFAILHGIKMARPSQEDIDWFRSTFHPIPKPHIPEDCVEYSLYWIAPGSSVDAPQEQLDAVRTALNEVQKTASGLVKDLLKDYIWQRDNFRLELTKEDGEPSPLKVRDAGGPAELTTRTSKYRLQFASWAD